METDHERERRLLDVYTLPLYLSSRTSGMAATIAALGRAASEHDVMELLGSHWRSRKVGALLSLVRSEASVRAAVLESLATSQGLLTSPELSVAAITLAGAAARPAMLEYRAAHVAHGWGSTEFIDEAIDWTGHPVIALDPSGPERSRFHELMALATSIVEAETTFTDRIHARISLPERTDHTPAIRLPNETLSLVLDPGDGGPVLGCRVTRFDGGALRSGDRDVPVAFDVWDASAAARLRHGQPVVVRYGLVAGSALLA